MLLVSIGTVPMHSYRLMGYKHCKTAKSNTKHPSSLRQPIKPTGIRLLNLSASTAVVVGMLVDCNEKGGHNYKSVLHKQELCEVEGNPRLCCQCYCNYLMQWVARWLSQIYPSYYWKSESICFWVAESASTHLVHRMVLLLSPVNACLVYLISY